MKFRVESQTSPGPDFPVDVEFLSEELSSLPMPLGGAEAVVSLSAVSPEDIAALNFRYRKLDEPTDVLSFPLWEEDGRFVPPQWDSIPLGDVVVCPGIVRRNAERENIGYNSEMARMIIHGVLHLIGFDHDTDGARREMWDMQESVLGKYAERVRAKGGLMSE